jgi:hypothetical protein
VRALSSWSRLVARDRAVGAPLALGGFTVGLLSLELSGSLLDRDDDFGLIAAEAYEVELWMNSGSGAFQGSCRWLSIDPSLVGFMPSSRAICTCAWDRRWRLRGLDPRLEVGRDRCGGLAHRAPQ